MERQRQIPQDLNHIHDTQVRFKEQSIALYAVEDIACEVEIPSRVEGRTVRRTMTVPTLVKRAEYADTASYLHEQAQHHQGYRKGVMETGWTLDDIPAEVHADCDGFIGEQQAVFADFLQAVDRQTQSPIDRMRVSQVCPQCRGSDKYHCVTCGTARRIYTYPLARLQDAATGEVYEVPFDIALYIREHPDDQVLRVDKTVDTNGRLSAMYALECNPTMLSAQYVQQATGGKVASVAGGLVYADGVQLYKKIELARWSEKPGGTYKNAHIVSSEELLEVAQEQIAQSFGERVEDIDYNALLCNVQRKLGEYSLSLFYHWQSGGMGDWSVMYAARKDSAATSDIKVRQSMTGDAFIGLVEFANNLKQALPSDDLWHP